MHYIVYLDEFGHIGPYHSRNHTKYKESPVFGLAGYILPLCEVRGFGTWFYQKKCHLLAWEIEEAKKHNCDFHPAMWEKKGAASARTGMSPVCNVHACDKAVFQIYFYDFFIILRKDKNVWNG